MHGRFEPGRRKTGGRKKRSPAQRLEARAMQRLCREHADEVIARLLQLMRQTKNPGVALAACKELLDRGFGRARQPINVESQVVRGFTWNWSMELLREIERLGLHTNRPEGFAARFTFDDDDLIASPAIEGPRPSFTSS
jgi:hypothetical protein